MIKIELLATLGQKIPIKECMKSGMSMVKLCTALRKENINVAFDKDFVYAENEATISKMADKLSNSLWLHKIARHRVKEDCEGCKYLDEDNPTRHGKDWCKKWDTDIWNVSTPFPEDEHTVNKGCVPFRYFGYTPNVPESQTQYSLKQFGAKNGDVVKAFVEAIHLNEVGRYFDKGNTFIGEFNEHNKFGIRYNKDTNAIQLKVAMTGCDIQKDYLPAHSSLNEMKRDWKEIWLGKAAEDVRMHGQRPDVNYDWINSEEYKKKHNLQKSKQFDISPTNVGDKRDSSEYNSFGDSDKDLGNLM